MARIRSIKPEFWRSPSTASASPWARLLYIAMWNWADDYGVGEWTPRELLGFAFPNDAQITSAEFQSLCTEVAACFGTQFYTVRGRRYYAIPSWDEHQKNERRARGKYPQPDDADSEPDREIHSNPDAATEKRGTSVQARGKSPAGTGEQGNREQGTGEAAPAVLGRLFDEAWLYWPKKTERKTAEERFKAAAKKIPPAELAANIERFGRAYASTTDKQFVPALGVWLGRERWTDELPVGKAAAAPTPTAPRDLTPAEHAHKWLADGSCVLCTARKDREDTW